MITEERISAFINSFDKGNTPFLDEIERFALENRIPVIRQEPVKASACHKTAGADFGGGNCHWVFRAPYERVWARGLQDYHHRKI